MWKPIILDVECIVCNKTLQKIKHDPNEASRTMGKITNRRSRTPNWSLDEKQYLLELIKEHKKVVVTKSNNGPNHSEEKDVVWNEILRQLTEKFGTKFSGFSIKKVKTQWQNMKRIAREEITLNGAAVQKYTRQSLEVCHILDLIKDDILKNENEPIINTDIEIKSENIDEDIGQPSCSGINTLCENPLEKLNDTTILESSGSSISEHVEVNDAENYEDTRDNINKKKSTFDMTKISFLEDILNTLPFHKDLQEFLKYSSTEKEIKMESLREERQVVRAMRETAELNKIIAEQKLKHILWIKKQEMA
ncbi:uncharacterized protein LOC113401372 [Vanessa tameamea]|uniref:Regulatory protein zeste n=1 Tax=Vanessa tameamea TaxID=334116 RepID=A0A8B8IKW7_VANTA|nr:uncharacterized protein LOC113401372 [Vanessa tameamea]